jgi:type VI secretion system protein ImpG
MVYPDYLAPIPSMAVVALQPSLTEGALKAGPTVKRDSMLRSLVGKNEQTVCEYRTAHEVTLWPLELAEAGYLGTATAVTALGAPQLPGLKAGLRLRLRTVGDIPFQQLPLDSLTFYLRGSGALPTHLYEQLLANSLALVVRSPRPGAPWRELIDKSSVRRVGYADEQSLLPYGPASFQGYRLLHEYFALPERYLFVDLTGLQRAVRRCADTELDIIVLLNRSDPFLENAVSAANFALFCTPAINLFPKRADRIHLSERWAEHHLVPDRSRPMDFEIYQVREVIGYGSRTEQEQAILPFYAANDLSSHHEELAYYTLRRMPRVLSTNQRRHGPRASYLGSEVFISLVDAREAPYSTDLRQLGVATLCTNRDLPLQMPVGIGKTDFTLESGEPVEAVRCLEGPTPPRPAMAQGKTSWRLISHLSLNYLSLLDSGDKQGAAALRELLMLYADAGEPAMHKQLEGLQSVLSRPVTRRMPIPGPIAFGRGLEITLTCDEQAFEGSGAFLLSAVLD